MKNIEFESFNEIINEFKFKILEHGHLYAGQDWKFLNLSSPFNRLYFVMSGSAIIKNKHHHIELKEGNMYLIPLYNKYDYICNNTLHKFYIHFRIELLPGHDLFEGCKECKSQPIDLKLIEEMVKLGRSGDVSGLLHCKGILLSCISNFLTYNTYKICEQIKITTKYQRLYEYITNNCYANLRVNDIANYLNIPLTNLSKNFKNDTGLTLKRYIDQKVIQKAQEQLLVTDKSIKSIAYGLKFSDEFHFSRFFKKYVGLPPNQYRQRNNTCK